MILNRHRGTSLGIARAAILALSAATSLHASIINEDFQNQTANSNPEKHESSGTRGGTVYSREDEKTGERIVNVVSSKTSPADPFGGSLNKSLRLYSSIANAAGGSVYFRSGSAGLKSGVLGLDFVVTRQLIMSPEAQGPWFSVSLGGTKPTDTSLSGTAKDSVTRIDFRSDGSILIRKADENIVADQKYESNGIYRLEIAFDTTTRLFSAKLNNVTLTTGNGAQSSWAVMSPSLEMVNAFQVAGLAAGRQQATGEAYVDNIVLEEANRPSEGRIRR